MDFLKNSRAYILLFLGIISFNPFNAQVSIISSTFNESFVTPELLNSPVIMAGPGIYTILIYSELRDVSTSEILIETVSTPQAVREGVNAIAASGSSFFSRIVYGSSGIANYIREQKKLPSGDFEYCIRIETFDGEYHEDSYCKDFMVVVNEFLRLVSPSDGDTISNPLPVLNWTTSAIQEKELGKKTYRILLAPMRDEQDAETALNVNPSQFIQENLNAFSVPYPSSAPELIPLQSYAWRVEVLLEGQIVDETDTWQFTIEGPEVKESLKYATLSRGLGNAPYQVYDGKIYFAFAEKYAGVAEFPECIIRSDLGEIISDPLEYDEEVAGEKEISEKESATDESAERGTVLGSNKFLLDVTSYNLKPGIYSLEVKNFKGEMKKLLFEIRP